MLLGGGCITSVLRVQMGEADLDTTSLHVVRAWLHRLLVMLEAKLHQTSLDVTQTEVLAAQAHFLLHRSCVHALWPSLIDRSVHILLNLALSHWYNYMGFQY